MGAKRSSDRFTWVEAEDRLLGGTLAGIQRGADSLRARPWLADAPAAQEELLGLDVDISVEKAVRARISSRRPAVHASALPPVDRLPRHPGCFHAPAGD